MYDPWRLTERPYESLVALVSRPQALTLSAEQPELVAGVMDWCHRYGLLGTLLHRMVMVTSVALGEGAAIEFADKEEESRCVPGHRKTASRAAIRRLAHPVDQIGESDEIPPASAPPLTATDRTSQDARPGGARLLLMEVRGVDCERGSRLTELGLRHFPNVPFRETQERTPTPVLVAPTSGGSMASLCSAFVHGACVARANGLRSRHAPQNTLMRRDAVRAG